MAPCSTSQSMPAARGIVGAVEWRCVEGGLRVAVATAQERQPFHQEGTLERAGDEGRVALAGHMRGDGPGADAGAVWPLEVVGGLYATMVDLYCTNPGDIEERTPTVSSSKTTSRPSVCCPSPALWPGWSYDRESLG